MFVVARWADDAPAADIAALAAVARSVRADPALRATGEWNGWAGLGPLADVPAGAVRLVPLPAGAIVRSPYRRCAVAFDVASDHFTCVVDGRTLASTRHGAYLGPEPASDMRPLAVVVRDGSVWVRYSD